MRNSKDINSSVSPATELLRAVKNIGLRAIEMLSGMDDVGVLISW
jgi:hypothetical protein